MRRASFLPFGCLVVLVLLLGTPTAEAGDCWGCHNYNCMQGFDMGALFCEETEVSCGFVYKLLGLNCEMRKCSTSGFCPRTLKDPDPSIDPSTIGGPGSGNTP